MHVCLFDIDGTLLSSGGAGKAAMEAALREEFGLEAIRVQVPYSGRTDRAIGRDLLRAHGVAESPENWQRLRDAYLGRLPECLHRHKGQVLPGIAALLEHLAVRGNVAVGLLTGNSSAASPSTAPEKAPTEDNTSSARVRPWIGLGAAGLSGTF